MSQNSLTTKPRKRTRTILNEAARENYFGEALRELRIQKEYTQEEAANLLGITQSQWSSYENGSTRPHLDIIITIAKKFEIEPLILVGKSLDKSKFTDPVLELTFQEYEHIGGIIEDYRKEKLRAKVQARVQQLNAYID